MDETYETSELVSECVIDTSIGRLRLQEKNCSLIYLRPTLLPLKTSKSTFLLNAAEQVREYLGGNRRQFDIAVSTVGSAFQMQVWQAIMKTNPGEALTYQELAAKIHLPKAARAVGTALSRNLILLVVPCHRVVLKSGSIGNYAMGKDIKEMLLQLEARLP